MPAEVTGRFPAWLRGKYVRNGPGELSDMEVSVCCTAEQLLHDQHAMYVCRGAPPADAWLHQLMLCSIS